MMNNNTEIKNKLENTIKEMLESNSVLKNKIIAHKESKSNRIQSYKISNNFFFVAIAHYIGATVLVILCLLEPSTRNIYAILESLLFFPIGFFINFIGKRSEGLSNIYNTCNIIDINDYNILYQTGNKEQREILQLFKYFDGNIKYKKVGI